MNTQKRLLYGLQNLKTSWCSFIKWVKTMVSHPSKKPPSLPSNIYHHCNELSLAAFIDCSVDRKYTSLIKYGRASENHLKLAWDQIYQEYSEKSGGTSYKLLMNLSRDVGYLETKRFIVAVCLKVLQHRADAGCIKILRNYGYKYDFDIANPQKYAEEINNVAQRTGSLTLAIEQKRVEIVNNTKKLNGREVTREHFDTMIAVISKFMARHIDRNQTTVSEFISYRKLYEREMEAIARVNEKQKTTPIAKGIRHGV